MQLGPAYQQPGEWQRVADSTATPEQKLGPQVPVRNYMSPKTRTSRGRAVNLIRHDLLRYTEHHGHALRGRSN